MDPHVRLPSRRLLVAACIASGIITAAGCARSATENAGRNDLDRRAALATLVVDNRTGRTLAISFRLAARPARSVEVGRVGPGRITEMAPVPAHEPIILEAMGEGLERRLEPRILEIDAVWTWVIADSMSHES